MEPLVLVKFVAGLGILVLGAEWLVRGAARLATKLGIAPVVVGLTVVAFGTSAPELAVSIGSAWSGRADLALGNVLGSNIFNVLFILGSSALITPLVVHRQIVRIEVPIMIGASLILGLLALDGAIGRLDGALLFGGIVAYTIVTVRRARREAAQDEEVESMTRGGGWWQGTAGSVMFVAAGLGLLVLGSRWLVAGAVALAEALGMSELIVGLTIVAAGTSLPEVATSILAAIRGHRDIAVGNVVGSNIFNIGAVLGATALVADVGVPSAALRFDLPVMIAVAVGCLPVFFTGHRIARWEGALFLGYYVLYTTFLVLLAMGRPEVDRLAFAVVVFVAPLTLLSVGLGLFRTLRDGNPEPT